MMLHLAVTGFLTLAPVALGIITIFGRKGKKEDEKSEKTPAAQQSKSISSQTATISDPHPSTTSVTSQREQGSSEPDPKSAETSLSQLLHSLLEDVPITESPEDDTKASAEESSSEWVPPLNTPPSRKMFVVEGDKGEKILSPFQSEEPDFDMIQQPPEHQTQPEEYKPEPSIKEPGKSPTPPRSNMEPETIKPSRPEKQEKTDTKQKAQASQQKTEQGPGRLFDLTNGALDSPGLVLITGPQGSGKTSLIFNMAGRYLANGTDCILVSYDQPVSSFRDGIRDSGWDAGRFESAFHLMIFDAFSGQTDSLSFEPYSMEKPFDINNVTETLVRNAQMMMTSRIKVILDSITGLASRNSSKDFPAKFHALSDKMRDLGTTFIVTVDPSKLTKETVASLEDAAACVLELQRDGQKGGQLKVKKLNGSLSKLKAEDFEIQSGKGLVFI